MLSSARLVGVPTEDLDAAWELVGNWVAFACKRNGGRMTPDDWYEAIKAKDCQLWLAATDGVIQAVIVTEIIVYPSVKWLHGHICYGHERADWQHLIKDLEKWAKKKGCAGLQMNARPGWEKIFKDYKKTHVFLEKSL